MFDARQILDALVGAAAIDPPQRVQQGAGQPAPEAGGASGGVGAVLDQILKGGQDGAGAASGGGLGELLGGLFGGAGQGGAGASAGDSGGGLADQLQQAVTRMAGPQAGDLLRQAMDFARTPKGAAILAGLAGLMLNRGGRRIASPAARLGGAALIGGLVYKALEGWRQGASPAETAAAPPAPAPVGAAGLTADSLTHDEAAALVQAMIAAACADGQVDDDERARITGALGGALPPAAVAFLENAFAKPLTPSGLAALASGPEHAAEIYEAARLAIDPDTPAEQDFLKQLATALGLDPELVAHLDAAAASARA
ncbi:tellurite resistance TerB family protein [Camelimonas abortus]|uniref:Tellurite resistance TerB family protein n=1 Tax=Camelimonas abortus TaxID=1017184 RepID=A0ABV7LAR9_9HYPH